MMLKQGGGKKSIFCVMAQNQSVEIHNIQYE